MDSLSKLISERIVILDGAMGTMLQQCGLSGDNEMFNFTHPEAVRKIHDESISAGADIIETNAFEAKRISQAEYGAGDRAGEMACQSAKIAKAAAAAAGRAVWVAGSIGPTGKSLTLAQNLSDLAYRPYSFDQMADALEEQIRGLAEGGVDVILLETCFDALNTKAAIYALERTGFDIPVMISASSSDRSGRTLTGQTIEAFYRSVQHARPISFGLNCSLGAEELAPLIEDVASWAECAVSCHPNAGLPDELGTYTEAPEQTARAICKMAGRGLLNIAGGCCGTTPAHIKAIAEALRGIAPRPLPAESSSLHVSGLEAVTIDRNLNNFTNIGERTNVAGSRKFARLIATGDYETAMQVAADQIAGGASIIDINMDDAMLDSSAQMQTFLRYISNDPAIAKAAVMVDSSHWETIIAGLKNAQGKCIVNSISLKEGDRAFIDKAREIKALGAAVVVMAFDENGQATTFDRKIDICSRAYGLLTEQAGFRTSDIIFDVNVLSIGTGMAEHSHYAVDFIEAVRWIKHNLPGTLTSGGISNLSFAFRGNNAVREAMHSAFLYHAIEAGLDMGIVNPSMLRVYDDIEPDLLKKVEDVILDSDSGATERLVEKAQQMLQEAGGAPAHEDAVTAPREAAAIPVGERLVRALVKGEAGTLEADILECLGSLKDPSAVIEGPLTEGMARVGELFGEGKMFLPQVIKSAKIMKNAVAILQPYLLENSSQGDTHKPKAVIATVKGDVHDIGKNITAIVLSCNGFDVTNMGVMVPKEDLLAKAVEIDADIVCASGLISPSLFQMEELCRELTARGMDKPLLIGGATTSALHTAVRLAPLYDHVFYANDASACAVAASRLISDRETFEKEEHLRQQKLRELYVHGAPEKKMHHEEAEPFPAESFLKGSFFKEISARRLTVADVLPFFDWKMFYTIWGIKGNVDVKRDDANEGIVRLNQEAISKIEEFKADGSCLITISARFDACHSEDDDIVSDAWRLPMLRQECSPVRSRSDFVPPKAYSFGSPAGMFAISVRSIHTEEHGCGCPGCSSGNEYDSILERSVRLTLAEAASGWLDAELRKQLPKDSPVKVIRPAAGYASCPDHTLKRDILDLLPGREALGIKLTETCAMIPEASICGMIFAHPSAFYPEIRRIGKSTIENYASRRGMTEADRKLFLDILAE